MARVRARSDLIPRVALALEPAGAALGEAIDVAASVSAVELPGWDPSHPAFVLGRLEGTPVAGWATPSAGDTLATRAAFVRLARLLGADVLVLALGARALAPRPGDPLGVVADHVGLLTPNPLVGPNLDDLGPRFPDLSEPYDPELRALAAEVAAGVGLTIETGVYASHPAPNRAGPLERSTLLAAGVDWLGEGGVAEVIVARHAGMRVIALVATPGGEGSLSAVARGVVARLG